MDQKTKDRLFTLGLDIPPVVAIKGDSAIDQWASQAIASALTEGGPAAEVVGKDMQDEQFGARPPTEDEVVGASTPQELSPPLGDLMMEAGLDLVEMLRKIEDTALELASLADERGDEAVYDRLGELPAWPEFWDWARAALAPAATAEPAPDAAPDPNAWQQGPATDPPRESGAVLQADGDPGEPEPGPEPEPTTDQMIEAIDSATPAEMEAAAEAVGFESYSMEIDRLKSYVADLLGETHGHEARVGTLEKQLGVLQAELLAYGVKIDKAVAGVAARLDVLEGRADDLGGRIDETLESYAARLDDQESQGRDQWSAIEANTAARIEAHQAAAEAETEPDDGSEAIEP